MKIHLLNTPSGLKPCNDTDYEEKKKLKIGQIYRAEIKQSRNYKNHKRYFAFISCAWEYLSPQQREFFKSKEVFRKTVQIAAGYSNPVYNLKKREWQEEAISISFDTMDETAFRELYDHVSLIVFNTFLKDISIEEFEKELINFL